MTGRSLFMLALLTVMGAAVVVVHGHARSESHQDRGCGDICEDVPSRCDCGLAYSEEFPNSHLVTSLLLLLGGGSIGVLASWGASSRKVMLHALMLALVARLSIATLGYSGADWHGETHLLEGLVLGLLSFPLGLFVWPLLDWRLDDVRLPYYGGDAAFGDFNLALDVAFAAAGALGYIQWFVVIPWLARAAAARRSRRTEKST